MVSTKHLIVTADDFGQSLGVNRVIIEAHEDGIVTSASLMTQWLPTGEAALYAKQRRSSSEFRVARQSSNLQMARIDIDENALTHAIRVPADMECRARSGEETRRLLPVTHWTWEQLRMGGRVLSVSKRDAYLGYLTLPQKTMRPFELAANIHPKDETGDRELLVRNGWKLVDPHGVASSRAHYQRYIKRSGAEFQCPKPIRQVPKDGLVSDRSACYLATGRARRRYRL
jgi:hypothetical protein